MCKPCPPLSGTGGKTGRTELSDCLCNPGTFSTTPVITEKGCSRCLPDFWYCEGAGPPIRCPENSRIEYGIVNPVSSKDCKSC